MSDETTTPPTDEGEHSAAEPTEDTPVGDMTEEGQTDIGPHPSLAHVENLEQADLDADAATGADGSSDQDE